MKAFMKISCFQTTAFLLLLLFNSALAHGLAMDVPGIQSYLRNNFSLRTQNWAVCQDTENHHIYIASSDGLIIFNGITWKKTAMMANLPLRSILAHTDGRIYTGSFEEFGYWQADETGELMYSSLAAYTEPEKNDEVWKIFAHNDKIYFQSFTTVYVYSKGRVEKVLAPYTMLFMHQISETFIVQIIGSGLFYFNDKSFAFIEGSEIFADKKVHAIIPYNDDQMLICTADNGLYLFDQESFTPFASEASLFLENFTCNTAKQLNDSTFAFGSILNGIIVTDKQGNIQQRFNTNNGLNNNTVLSLHVDSDNGLWIALDEGVNYLDLFSPFTHYRSHGGSMGSIYAMLKHDDKLYIGTNHGLFVAHITRNKHLYAFDDLRFIEGSQGQVWALEEIGGQIICGHNEGTFLVDGYQMDKISDVTGAWTFIPYQEYVIGGTYTGIIVLEKGPDNQWKFRNKVENFLEPTRFLETDYLGYFWASHHQKGVFKIQLSDDLTTVIQQDFFDEIEGNPLNMNVFKLNNRVVFATGENIYTWDYVRNEMVLFETLTDYLDEFSAATQIISYKRNLYWFVKNEKLALFEVGMDFSPQKIIEIPQEFVNLPQRQLQLLSLDENTILLPNPQNFDAFNLSIARGRQEKARLAIDMIKFYGERDTLRFFQPFTEISIPFRSNSFIVSFSDPSDFSNYPKSFLYRIKELDQSWQTTNRDYFNFINLKHGYYTLQLSNNRLDVVEISFKMAKPWYISHVAILMYIVAFMALSYGLTLFFRFQIARQRELAAMEVRQSSLEKELDYKSYELMLTMRHLLLKDTILNDLKKQIDLLKEQSSKYPVKHIKNMERVIQQGLGTQSVEWENALNNLKLSQQGFFKELKEKYPSLTPNDLRMCSYLRMNFNTKEIAQLLNISARGVEVGRHRLRKKLNLSNNENLVEFLMNEEFHFSDQNS